MVGWLDSRQGHAVKQLSCVCVYTSQELYDTEHRWYIPTGLSTGSIPRYCTWNFCTSSVFGVGKSTVGNKAPHLSQWLSRGRHAQAASAACHLGRFERPVPYGPVLPSTNAATVSDAQLFFLRTQRLCGADPCWAFMARWGKIRRQELGHVSKLLLLLLPL